MCFVQRAVETSSGPQGACRGVGTLCYSVWHWGMFPPSTNSRFEPVWCVCCLQLVREFPKLDVQLDLNEALCDPMLTVDLGAWVWVGVWGVPHVCTLDTPRFWVAAQWTAAP